MGVRCGTRDFLEDGITLLEMLIVLLLFSLAAAISYPSLTSGIDSMRLSAAADQTAELLNAALLRAQRRQEVTEVVLQPAAGRLLLFGRAPQPVQVVDYPQGVRVLRVDPAEPDQAADAPRSFVLLPGGSVPALAIELVNARGARRRVRIDRATGVPLIERLPG